VLARLAPFGSQCGTATQPAALPLFFARATFLLVKRAISIIIHQMSFENLDRANTREAVDYAVPTYMQVRDTPFALGADGGDLNALIAEGVGGCTRKHLFFS